MIQKADLRQRLWSRHRKAMVLPSTQALFKVKWIEESFTLHTPVSFPAYLLLSKSPCLHHQLMWAPGKCWVKRSIKGGGIPVPFTLVSHRLWGLNTWSLNNLSIIKNHKAHTDTYINPDIQTRHLPVFRLRWKRFLWAVFSGEWGWGWRPGRLLKGAHGLELHMKRTSFPGSKESSFLGNQLCPVL